MSRPLSWGASSVDRASRRREVDITEAAVKEEDEDREVEMKEKKVEDDDDESADIAFNDGNVARLNVLRRP